MMSCCFLDFSVGVGAFFHRTESDLFLFLFCINIVAAEFHLERSSFSE